MAESVDLQGAGEDGFELLAASLRASGGDLRMFVEVLADKFEQALPGRVRVERRAVRFLSKEKRVARIEVELGDSRYVAVAEGGGFETRCAKVVRGVVLKSEVLPLQAWLESLGRELAVEAEASEQSRRALQQLLEG